MEAVESALSQTLAPFEVLVVDDASTDDTPDNIRRLTDNRILLIRREVNGGQCAAINSGILAAKGDLIATLDSDDLWHPLKLEQQVNRWLSSAHPPSTIVYSRVIMTGEGYERIMPKRAINGGERIGEYLFVNAGMILQSSLLLPRGLALTCPLDERVRRHSDLGWCLNLEAIGAKFQMVPDPLVRWRTDAGGARLSNSPNSDASLNWLANYAKMLTPSERAGFCARSIAPSIMGVQFWRSVAYIYASWWAGSLTILEGLSIIARGKLPSMLDRPARRLAHMIVDR